MTRQEFVKIRKRRGDIAIEGGSRPCQFCGRRVIDVTTRPNPLQYMTWDPGNDGEIHRCAKTRRVDAG